MTVEVQRPAAGEPPLDTALSVRSRTRWLPPVWYWAGLGLALVIAHRGLIGFDSSGGPTHDLRGVEELLFAPTSSSPLLVFSVAVFFVWQRWPRFLGSLGAPSQPLLALVPMALGFALCGWAYFVGEPALLIPSLSLWMLASSYLLGGTAGLRALLLPSLFLFFAMPLPPALVNRFMYPLQLATASWASQLLAALGIDAHFHAEQIYWRSMTFQVIESCSGLRSIETIFMSSFIYHDLFFRSRLQSTLLVIGSLGIGVLINVVRVMTIVLNPYSRFAAVHTIQGLAMIVVGVLLLAALDSLLSRFLAPASRRRRTRASNGLPRSRAMLLAIAVAALLASSYAVKPWQSPPLLEAALSSFPPVLDGWSGSGLKLDREFLGSVSFSEWVHRRYERGSERVDVMLGSNRRLDSRIDFGSPKTAVPGSGWEVTDRRTVRLDSGREVEQLHVQSSASEQQLVLYWTYGTASAGEEVMRSVLGLDRGPWRRSGRALAVRLVTPLDAEPSIVEMRIRTFAAAVEREMAALQARSS